MSDLHAVDGRYHYDCKTKFMAPKSVKLAASETKLNCQCSNSDIAFEAVVKYMEADKSAMRNSSEIYSFYQDYGGTSKSKRTLINELSRYFNDELSLMNAAGISSILVFREEAKDIFKMVYKEDNDDDDDLHCSVKTLVQQLKRKQNNCRLIGTCVRQE